LLEVWRNHYRAVVFRPDNLNSHVDGADIDQPARSQLEFQKAVAIGAKGHLVVDAGDHVTEVRRRHVLLRDRLEVEYIERFLGIGNQLVQITRSPDHRIWQPRRRVVVLRECWRADASE
jgi:hypothetical protein